MRNVSVRLWLLLAVALSMSGWQGAVGWAGPISGAGVLQQAAVIVSPTSLTVSEPNGSATFQVTLTSRPSSAISFSLLATSAECTVSRSSVDLNPGNWEAGATLTVTAVDDALADGPQACTIATGTVISGDPAYNGLDPADVAVTVLDDEYGVLVWPTSLGVSEPDGEATFVLSLTRAPLDSVSVPLSTSNTQCSVLPATVTLNGTNWASGVTATVAAVDDAVADGPQDCQVITGLTTSADPAFHNLNPADVMVTVQDDEASGIVVSPTSLQVAEPNGAATFVVSLSAEPAAAVTIPLRATGDECTVTPAQAVLDATNWMAGVTATVRAVDDWVVDGPQSCLVVTDPATSADPRYDGLNAEDVSVTVTDDDVAGVTVDPTSLAVSEPAGSATFRVALTSEPLAAVTIPLVASNTQCSVSPAALVLNELNWSAGVVATVTAVDDTVADGDASCIIQTGPAVSADAGYNGLNPADVTVMVSDDDEARILVEPTTLVVSEPAGSATFVLRLASMPGAPVLIPLSASNDQCSVWPATATLHSGNWGTGVTATVTAVDDDVLDGPQPCLVQTGVTTSGDATYHGLNPADVSVTVLDDEVLWRVYLPQVHRGWPPLPAAPVLRAISNPAGLGTYTVAWDAAARAETYALEESKSGTFATASQVYAGPATSHLVSGRGAARYYYRAKARNVWGDSGWSNVASVDVLWEAEPNDDALTQANGPIVSGLTYYGTFLDGGDAKDYYTFDLLAPHTVELHLGNIAGGQNYDLVLRNASLESVGYSAQPGTSNEYVLTGSLPAGRYYIQVYRYSGTGSDQPYHLRAVFE